MPKVSVIVPNYNHARFLPQRIETILGQTYTDFDLLVMDDVSTDNSREVIQRYAGDPRISTLFNEQNSGSPYKQWRTGLARTQGEYVWIAESDDYAEPTFLERMVELLDAHPKVGIATCDSWEVDEQGQMATRYSDQWRHLDVFADYDLSFLDQILVMDGREYCRRYMDPWNTIPNASGAVFRRSAMDKAGGPVTDMRLCGDWLTYCKILMHADMARHPAPLNDFRRHAVSVRTSVRSVQFVRESMEVQAYVARELGLGDRHKDSYRVREFYSQALIAAERGGERNKVPLSRAHRVLREAWSFGPAMLAHTARILFKEQAGSTLRHLGWKR